MDGRVVACAELAPLSASVAEVRSLVVDRTARGGGVGRRLVDELVRRAAVEGFERLCAFSHEPGYFMRMGFSLVPHTWVPEKLAADCRACALFRQCGQHAVVRPVTPARRPRHA
ncbi:MAG: GNAT family N-acetyltransferase [Vicinamibacterales bacterium]